MSTLKLLGTMFYRFNIFSALVHIRKSCMFAIPEEVHNFLFLHFAEQATFIIFDFDFVDACWQSFAKYFELEFD